MSHMQLTWAGFDAAVDLIACQCTRHHGGIFGASHAGKFLAVAVGYRLGMPVLERPAPGMLLMGGVVRDLRLEDKFWDYTPEIWVWVDQTPQHAYNSVMTTDTGVNIAMPWQDAMTPTTETFISGFHD